MPSKLPRCKVGRCKRIARTAGFCKTHATKKADTKFSLRVREEGKCYGATKFWIGPYFPCAGHLSCCHLFSRRYRNVRWDERNAVSMCAAHHAWFDQHPIEKDDMMLEWLEMDYEELKDLALDDTIDWRVKMEEVLNEADQEG